MNFSTSRPTDAELLQIISEGETDRVEFTESLSGYAAERIREAVCAFANDLPAHGAPGLALVGVKDDGTLAGISVTDRLLQRLADMKTDGNILPPPVPVSVGLKLLLAQTSSPGQCLRLVQKGNYEQMPNYLTELQIYWNKSLTTAN